MNFRTLGFACFALVALVPVAGCASETSETPDAVESSNDADSIGDQILCTILHCDDWNSGRWIQVGETPVIDGFFPEQHSVDVNNGVGRVKQIQLRIREGGAQIDRVDVYMRDGSSFSPDFSHSYGEGERTQIVDLPRPSKIDEVSVRARKELFGSGTVVEVWVRR